MYDFNSFPIMFNLIISTTLSTHQKIGDLFCHVHISGFSHSMVQMFFQLRVVYYIFLNKCGHTNGFRPTWIPDNGQRRGFVGHLQTRTLHLCRMGLWRITQVIIYLSLNNSNMLRCRKTKAQNATYMREQMRVWDYTLDCLNFKVNDGWADLSSAHPTLGSYLRP